MSKSVDTAEYIHKLETENEQLKKAVMEYGHHKNDCKWDEWGNCTCGLSDIIKKAGGEL